VRCTVTSFERAKKKVTLDELLTVEGKREFRLGVGARAF
jgi:hypothetical protein